MKKSIISFLVGVILTLSVSSYAITAIKSANYNNTKVALDGEPLTLATDFVTVVNEGQTNGSNFAPVRALFEAVGYTVGWDRPTNTILLESPLTDLETVAKNCKDSCVMIYATMPDGTVLQGSGFVYNNRVITAKHVVEGAEMIHTYFDGARYGVPSEIVPTETKLDVAVIKTYGDLISVKLGDSDKLKEGEKLVSISCPGGIQNSVDECVNSGLAQIDTGSFLVISESSMIGGSSGGAIFNYDGEVVAMVIKGDDGNNFAVPINDIKPILENLK